MRNQDHSAISPNGQQLLFAALTFIIVLIVVMMSTDTMTAVMVSGFIIGFAYYIINSSNNNKSPMSQQYVPQSYVPPQRAPQSYAPQQHAPQSYAPQSYAPQQRAPRTPQYLGAIDIDEFDSEAKYGYHDLQNGDNSHLTDGNPFNGSRLRAPVAADSCIDDEANDDVLDGDERMNYQARARNDPARAVAGSMNRRRDMDRYFREEVAEEADMPWWGRHEY